MNNDPLFANRSLLTDRVSLPALLLGVALALSTTACDQQAGTAGPSEPGEAIAAPGSGDAPVSAAATVNGAGVPTVAGSAPSAGVDVPSAARPLEVVREFTCDPAAIQADTAVSDVQNLPGATVDIRPLGGEEHDCSYHLVFRDVDGTMTQLSPPHDPGGYLLAIAGQSPAGHLMVCASDIDHSVDPSGSAAAGEQPRRIDEVGVDCTLKTGDSWAPMSRVVQPDSDWAAWVIGLEAANDGSATFRVLWIRDFSFQFLNLSDAGRPAGDGIYATEVSVDADGGVLVGTTTLISERIVPEDAHEYGAWEPTAEELEELDGYVVRDDGDCPPPHGCK